MILFSDIDNQIKELQNKRGGNKDDEETNNKGVRNY